MVLNTTQLYGSNRSNWDGNGLGYGAIEVTDATTESGTLPVGAYIFVQDRILRTTDSGSTFRPFAQATAAPGTQLARGKGFFEQSEVCTRLRTTYIHTSSAALAPVVDSYVI